MAYKSIFTAVTDTDTAAPSLAFASECSKLQDAHLDLLCIGMDRVQSNTYEVGANAFMVQQSIEAAQEKAQMIYDSVREKFKGDALRWEARKAITTFSGVGRTVATQARFSDLAVLSLPYGEDKKVEDSLILEGLLFEADCPTVVVPDGAATARPKNITIGWNEGPEALRAVRASLPFLRMAEKVHIAIIDPPEHGPERSDPGGALAVYLARHGIACDIQVMSRSGAKVSERLARHVTETGSEMLVMGGYGHSRFREAILGGATRDMLEHSKVPVLMAH